jgi:hypothetical protein
VAYLDLVIAKKSIHEGKEFMTSIGINELVDEGSGEVVFRTSLVEVAKVCANPNGTLFLIDRDKIGYPGCVCDGVYEASCM